MAATVKAGKEVHVFEFFSFWVSNAILEVEEKGNNQLYEMVHVKE